MIHEMTVILKDEEELDVKVEYDYSPGRKGRMYMANGDPGYPDEPAEVEAVSIVDAVTGREIHEDELAEGEQERINESCMEDAAESAEESRMDAAIAKCEFLYDRF